MNYHEVSSLKNFENMSRNPTSTTDLDALLRRQLDGGAFPQKEQDTVIKETVTRRTKMEQDLQKLITPLSRLKEAKEITQYLDRYLTGAYLEEKATLNINRADKAKNSIEQKITETNTSIDTARTTLNRIAERIALNPQEINPDTTRLQTEMQQKRAEINGLTENKKTLEGNLALTKEISGVAEKHLERIHVDMANKEEYQLRISTNFDKLANWLGRRQITNNNLHEHIEDVKNGKNYWMNGPEKAFSLQINMLFLEAMPPPLEKCLRFNEQLGHTYSAERRLDSPTLEERKAFLDETYWPTGPRNWGPIKPEMVNSTANEEKQKYVGYLQASTRERANTIANALRLRPRDSQNAKVANYLDFATKTPSEMFDDLNARRSMRKLEPHEANYLRDAENERDLQLIKNTGKSIVLEVFKMKQSDPNHTNRLENIRVDEERCMNLHENIYNTLVDLAHDPLMEVKDLDSHIKLEDTSIQLQKHKIAFHNDNVETANAVQQGVHEFIHDRYFNDLSQGHFKSMEEAIKSWGNLGQNMGTTITNASLAFGTSGLVNDAVGRVIGNTLANTAIPYVAPAAKAAKMVVPH